MAKNSVRIPFPYKGKDENWAMGGQPPLTSPDLQNVRPRDVQDKRSRGGQRPAVRKIMYWWDYPGGGADLGLPDPSPIIGMDQVTAVYYASIAGGDVDPGEGDPSWDGIVLFSIVDVDTQRVQLYDFAGNELDSFDIDAGYVASVDSIKVELDKTGHIYLYDLAKIFQYDRTLNQLQFLGWGSGHDGGIFPSIKDDDILFVTRSNDLSAYHVSDFDTQLWTANTGQSRIHDIAQLENSDDILISFSQNFSDSVRRVSRVDGSTVRNYDSMGMGARSIAVDETNGWVYKVGGFDADAQTKVYRCDLSDGGNITSFNIPGGDAKKVRLYGGEVYVCGGRATDNNTVWKLDAGLVGIEASYDTGAQVNSIRILSTGVIYAAGADGTNEDAVEGNVNVLNASLVRSDTWDVSSGLTVSDIAEKWV